MRPSRRRFLQAVPAAVAGAIAVDARAQRGPQGPVTADIVKAGETIDGVTFSGDEDVAAAAGANRNLNSFNRLRQTPIPQHTEPAYMFRPALPGREPNGPATPGAPIKVSRPDRSLQRPANLEDTAFWPLTRLASLVERKQVTSTELTRMYLARLKRYQPTLNFYVTLTEDLALKQAAEADREIRAGKYRGPLHGLPWGAKDLFATKGIKTTWGGEPYVNQIFDYDATIVERLRDAGAVLAAKLTLGALAQGDRWFGGQTRNPWNPDTGSSGSSAGPASATAAGCVAFAIGTETRGSILSPASVNGVVGLRPTYGRVSRHGAMALSPTMDKIGPLCRYVEDAVLAFNAIYGPDKRDGSVADAAFKWNPDAPLSGFRIAYVKSAFDAVGQRGRGAAVPPPAAGPSRSGPSPEQLLAQGAELNRIYGDVLAVYQKLGARLEAVELPEGMLAAAQPLSFILEVEAAAAFDDITRSGEVNALSSGTSKSTWPNTFREGRLVPAVEYIRAMRARTMLMRRADDFFSQDDAVLEPGTGDTLGLTNLTGHPALALKCGFTAAPGYAAGQPRVLMITGRLYDEATICRIARAYEQATEWKDRHPALQNVIPVRG